MPDSSLLCLHTRGYWEQFTLHSELLVLATLKSNPCFLFIYSFLEESLTNIYWLPLGHNDALCCLKGQVRFSPWWKSSLSLILKMEWYWLLHKGVVGCTKIRVTSLFPLEWMSISSYPSIPFWFCCRLSTCHNLPVGHGGGKGTIFAPAMLSPLSPSAGGGTLCLAFWVIIKVI